LAAAGDKYVNVLGASTAQQCLEAGVLDEILVLVAPVLLGDGVRLFDRLADTPVVLGDPKVVDGVGVTHLRYPVRAG
jgi:dihydrofolate reductase